MSCLRPRRACGAGRMLEGCGHAGHRRVDGDRSRPTPGLPGALLLLLDQLLLEQLATIGEELRQLLQQWHSHVEELVDDLGADARGVELADDLTGGRVGACLLY